ncbi:hypothetical protein ESY86_08675 [Subsaximicrobium wynnwilliamsii]|uniref:Porin family protein n=1 Tax=Subsaximicrobium wynnwilliamsii TaxID=291179 RepID=A0A5C6ZI41_9FLAO|nr:hypothetical protein [Subsaximicrobium wynnwilliamsii]TXD83670.1 hypothetical protein ESY87_08530 [Subsaximicrobium wynnwilliamsii]TXD89446.1 hypothetical protein ESY86_08675 [Subsaximicrobium wynnwilliamsii]TXE03507.1 hypothetical protein ESY88_07555 [Subsaximicrobium wynnwilliamsii]
MKKLAFFFCFIVCSISLQAQETHLVDGESVELEIEANGKLDLLWKIINREYRYFVKTESNELIELKNTESNDGDFQYEYRTTLNQLTQDETLDTGAVNFTLSSLKAFVDAYNAASDNSYQSVPTEKRITTRLGVFGGITNSPFISNPDNLKSGLFGAELEVLDARGLMRSALFMQVRHVLEHDDLAYSTTEIALGYRFRVVNKRAFNLYVQTKFATLNFSDATIVSTDENDILTQNNIKETSFDIPLIFGIGVDIRVSENSFITLGYDQLFAILIDNQGNFSTDFTLGYKFNL